MRLPIVTGISNHNGWAIFVSVAVHNGTPAVIDRRRVELLDPGLPNQPYEHETKELNKARAEALVQEVRESALHCAERAFARLRSGLGEEREIVAIALRKGPLPQMPGSVAEVHASYHLLARADAMLYHHAVCTAALGLGIAVELLSRGEELPRAAEALKTTPDSLDQWLTDLRESLGSPWQKDHREATAHAIAALGKHAKLKTL